MAKDNQKQKSEEANSLQINMKPLSWLKPYAKNPRVNDKAVPFVAESIKNFGFLVPIVANKDGVILSGHTRFLASKLLGLAEVPVLVVDNLTEAKERAYRIADNKVADMSTFDNRLLLEELKGIADLDADAFTGFEIGEIFDDVMDEGDKELLEEEQNGVYFRVILRTQDKERAEKIVSQFKTEEGIE